ncbi:MAG: hypothetical protein CMJ18_16020 [Phycisphaeraceae bacterium]|nr:hypothetical protein [Phycisphaeraceae bacterium]
MSVELHCHTVFSVDARGTPEDLVDVAADRGVTTLSITEHDHIGSCARAQARATERGLEYLPGVELGAPWEGVGLHLLAIGFDPENEPMKRMVDDCFSKYERQFGLLEPHLRELGCRWTKQQMAAGLAQRYPTHPAPVVSQWFARDFLVEQGVFPDLAACKAAINQVRQRITDERGPEAFQSGVNVQRILETVHGAGGVVLLAHVANYHPADLSKQISLIHDVLDAGLDGFELHHPRNIAEPHFDALVSEAQQLRCVISGGSDCHDARLSGVNALNCCHVPEQTIERLRSALASG